MTLLTATFSFDSKNRKSACMTKTCVQQSLNYNTFSITGSICVWVWLLGWETCPTCHSCVVLMTEAITDQTSLSEKLFSHQKFVSLEKQSPKGLCIERGMWNVCSWLKADVWVLQQWSLLRLPEEPSLPWHCHHTSHTPRSVTPSTYQSQLPNLFLALLH